MNEVPLTEEPLRRARKQRRPRWIDAAGLSAAAVIILVVGFLGHDGKDHATLPPTSTTLSTTSTTTEPTTTSTTAPNPIVFGQLLPRKTRTVVALVGESAKLIDLDSGTVRTLGPEFSSNVLPGDHGFLFWSEREIRLVSAAGALVESHPGESFEGFFAGSDEGAWLRDPATSTTWIEIDGHGRRTGASVAFPFDAYPVATVDDGIIVNLRGSSTLLRRDGGRRSLGAGEVIGGSGQTFARVACEQLRCHLTIEDLVSGNVRRLPQPIENAGWARFAPGGRWAQVFRDGPGDQPLTLLDLRTMRVEEIAPSSGPTAFTRDGSYLLAVDGGILRAYDLEASAWLDLNQIGTTAGQLVTAAA